MRVKFAEEQTIIASARQVWKGVRKMRLTCTGILLYKKPILVQQCTTKPMVHFKVRLWRRNGRPPNSDERYKYKAAYRPLLMGRDDG